MITFGIWPGVVDRDLIKLEPLDGVPAEDVGRTRAALDELAGGAELYIRSYRNFDDQGAQPPSPADPGNYLRPGRRLDLVLGYSSDRGDVDGFVRHVRDGIRRAAGWPGAKVQVTEEINAGLPLDGGRPRAYEALAAGLAAAFAERWERGAEVMIGFNAAAPNAEFWQQVERHVTADLLGQVDFLGIDLFPGVFRPLPEDALKRAVTALLRDFRQQARAIGVSADVPIHVTETGWPTGPEHSEEDQAAQLVAVAQAVLAVADELNITAYEVFGLRDGRTGTAIRDGFGLLRDDYSPKPAFAAVRELIARS